MAFYDAQQGRASVPEAELTAAQRDADEASLHAGVCGVAEMVAGSRSVTALLADVAKFAAAAIPGADGAGAVLACAKDGSHEWAASTAEFGAIEDVQYVDLHEGPGLAALQSRRPTVSGSLGSDGRWPRFGGRVARMAVHSALALPLVVDDRAIGAIDVYGRARDAFGQHAVDVGTHFVRTAAAVVCNAVLLADASARTSQLQHALDNRPMIDQAIGIIRSRSGVTSAEAFDKLMRLSQTENVKLHLVAERLVTEAVGRARALRQQ